MSDASFVLFLMCSVSALAGALGTVASRRPLRGAVSLLVMIIALAGLYLTLAAELLAAIQLLVYAGAVVVLFVFVIMLIGPAAETPPNPRGIMVRILSFVGMGMFTATVSFSLVDVSAQWVRRPDGFGTVEGVGSSLYTQALVPFEIISITMTVAIVGAVAVARSKTARELAEARERAAAMKAEAEAAKAAKAAKAA